MTFSEWRDAVPGDYAVLGDPVDHSLSPSMFEAMFNALELKTTYVAIRVPLLEFDDALGRLMELGYRGVNCTVPLKEAARNWCEGFDSLLPVANTLDLHDRRGTNTDAPAFLTAIKSLSQGKKVLVLGAGGTSRAVIPALVFDGYEVGVWNRTPEKIDAIEIESNLKGQFIRLSDPNAMGFDVVVNTTSASLSGEAVKVDWRRFEGAALDVAYAPAGLTPFLTEAHQHGFPVADGRAMLVEQGALAYEWWTGQNALRSVMLEAIQCP